MPLISWTWLKSRRTWALAITLAISAILAWAVERHWHSLDGYGSFPRGLDGDELIGGNILEVTDPDQEPSVTDRGEETCKPAEIDGEMGKLCQGRYGNGTPWYLESWLHNKQHG